MLTDYQTKDKEKMKKSVFFPALCAGTDRGRGQRDGVKMGK